MINIEKDVSDVQLGSNSDHLIILKSVIHSDIQLGSNSDHLVILKSVIHSSASVRAF